PVPGGGNPSLGALFAGRRRPAPFGGSSLRTLALLARLVGAALVEAGRAPEAGDRAPRPPVSTELGPEAVARAGAAAGAGRPRGPSSSRSPPASRWRRWPGAPGPRRARLPSRSSRGKACWGR